MILDSLPFGGDMDETLQPDVSPSEWIHTAPIQELLSRGESAEAATSPPKPEVASKAPPATTVRAEEVISGVGGHKNYS